MTIPARVAALVAALLTAPCVAVCGGCAAVTACHATYTATGPYVRSGEVWDDLRVWCSPSPASHALTARMLYRRVGEYTPLGRAVFTDRVPDADGFAVSVHVPCVSGWYRASASVTATDTGGHTSTVTLQGRRALHYSNGLREVAMSTTPTATYLGRRVRWCGGDLYVPAEHCPPGALVTHDRVEVAPHVWELADGVRITAGDEGTVVAFLGVDELGEVYRVQFTSGAVFTLGLPQPHAIAIAAA